MKKRRGKMLNNNETPQINENEVTDLPHGFCFNTHMACYISPGCPDFEFVVLAEISIIEDWLNLIF